MELIADRYELGEPLGQGGMAHVRAARDRVLDRPIAMKLLRRDIGMDDVLRERFLREARLAARLNHAHIVRVYDAGVAGETPWMAMELVEGRSLRQVLTEDGAMPAAQAVEVMSQVLSALTAAHQAGVIHRDVKPGNVLLSPEGAKLSDFGIARSLSVPSDLTQTNQFMGTPKYTAPEVAMGLEASARSDLYSAAVVLWEALAGHPPFEHENPLSLAMMHRTDPLPPLGERRPDLPGALVTAVEAGLAKEPAARPADCAAFAALLQAGLRGDAGAVAAAASPTAVIPRIDVGAPSPVPEREQTLAMPRPRAAAPAAPPPPPRPADRAATGGRGRSGVVGVVVAVLVLLGLAAAAFTLTDDGGDPAATESPSPTPTATTPTATPTTAPDAGPTAAPPPPPPAATEPPPPVATTTPPTEPPPEPVPTDAAPAPADPGPDEPAPVQPPEPTPQTEPLIELLPGGDSVERDAQG